MAIAISHTTSEGTLVEGDPRPHHQIVKDAGFRYSRNVGWYLPHSRFKPAQTYKITPLAERLREAGFEVTVTIDDAPINIAEREQVIAERAAERADRLSNRADRLAGEAAARFEKADQMASVIPFGQPILVGHYSEGRDRRYRDRIGNHMDKGLAAHREAEVAERAAVIAAKRVAHREAVPVTLRRIEKLEAERRKMERALVPCRTSGKRIKETARGVTFTCPACYHDQTVGDDLLVPTHGCATGEYAERVIRHRDDLIAEVAYWRGIVAEAEAAGVKLWGPDDFVKGDFVRYWGGWSEVVRVNKKSLSVKTAYSWTDTLPYDKVLDKRKEAS